MEWWHFGAGVAAGGAAIGATWFILSRDIDKTVIVAEEKTAIAQQDVIKQLTDLDLVQKVCEPSFIVKNDSKDLLCREWICRMMQRGIDAKTSQVDCSEIANVANKITVKNFCSNKSVEKERACIEFFDRRL